MNNINVKMHIEEGRLLNVLSFTSKFLESTMNTDYRKIPTDLLWNRLTLSLFIVFKGH